MSDCHGCAGCAVAEPLPSQKGARPHVVAIIGPPNSGKSTLFNRLTGLRQKVANFPGVTVEQRMGKAKMHGTRHDDVVLVDLPGVYSLNPRSEDEQVTHDVLAGDHAWHPEARRGAADSGLHQPGPPPGAGRADSQPEAADAGDPQHGRRSEEPRRRTWTPPNWPASWVRRWR